MTDCTSVGATKRALRIGSGEGKSGAMPKGYPRNPPLPKKPPKFPEEAEIGRLFRKLAPTGNNFIAGRIMWVPKLYAKSMLAGECRISRDRALMIAEAMSVAIEIAERARALAERPEPEYAGIRRLAGQYDEVTGRYIDERVGRGKVRPRAVKGTHNKLPYD